MRKQRVRSYLKPCSNSVVYQFLPPTHDTDHLLTSCLSHKPLVYNPSNAVVASSQCCPSAESSRRHQWALQLGLFKSPQNSHTPRAAKGILLNLLSWDGESSWATAAADVPEEFLDQSAIPLRAGIWHNSGGFSCSGKLSSWTGSRTGTWGETLIISASWNWEKLFLVLWKWKEFGGKFIVYTGDIGCLERHHINQIHYYYYWYLLLNWNI